MPHQTKIATCCYCSARTLLKPTARKGHELACGSCGAPLHEMKWLKSPEPAAPARPKVDPQARAALISALNTPSPKRKWREKPKKRRKPRKSAFRKLMEEAWDIAEDIFD